MNTPRIVLATLLVFASLLTVTPVAAADGTVVDLAVADGRFTTLVAALQAADLVETLQGDGPFTVFAPTDDAFAALPAGTIDALLADVPTLTNVLLYHVVSGNVLAADVVGLTGAQTVLGDAVSVRVQQGNVFINDAQVVITDLVASNGVIHVIDTVLLPPTDYTVKAGDYLSRIAGNLLGDTHRYDDIVALTNAAWQFDNSYAHIANANVIEIGDKLSIPGYLGATEAEAPAVVETPDIVEIAVADGRFTTLVAALTAADLVETLQGDGPFTVFAPTDDAFAALPEGTVPALLNDIPALTDILLYHVVSGQVMAADVAQLDSATTVQGEDVTIQVDNGQVMVNESNVIITDIEASNGVIHVIDAVLLPPAEEEEPVEAAAPTQDIVEIAVADGRFTTLVAALTAADLVETLQGDGPFTVFAPTDDAFAALPEGTVPALLNDIPTLTDILLYHVVAGKVMAADVVNLDSATTVQGAPALIEVSNGMVMVDNAQVIITDIEATNGVIHVIDAVILPPTDYTVVAGDTLYGIAARELGDGRRYTEIVELTNLLAETDDSYNAINNANVIEIGWTIALP